MSSLAAPPYTALAREETPLDYHKLLPSIVQPLPEQKFVGLLACQRDPLLQTLATTITSITPYVPPPPPPSSKSSKKPNLNKPSTSIPSHLVPSSPNGKLYQVETLDSVLFPEGGGQPSDEGVLVLAGQKEGSGEISMKVKHVMRRGLRAVHFIEVEELNGGEEAVGLEVEKKVELRVDWARRLDHMTHHTAQHLLSALLETLPSPVETLSWSLTSAGPCYIEVPRALTPEEIASVEKRANELIRVGTRVYVEVDDQARKEREQAEKDEAEGRVSKKGIPKDYEGGVVRTIVVEGVDRNPCCGTHTPSLSLLQSLHILPLTTPHSPPTRRLHFLTSSRLLSHAASLSLLLASTSSALGSGGVQSSELPARVAQLADQHKTGTKALGGVKQELADLLADGLVGEILEGKKFGVYKHRECAEATSGVEFLGFVANAVGARLVEEKECLVVLSATPSPFVPGSTSSLLLAGPATLVTSLGDRIKKAELFKGRVKGGGAKGRWQAKVEGTFGIGEKEWIESTLQELSQQEPK